MAIRHGIVAASVFSAPQVTATATTNFNQNRATLNGLVSANGDTTTNIKFQLSSDGGSTWVDASGGTAISNTSAQNVSVFYEATGLTVGTYYQVRLIASNSHMQSVSNTESFLTWSLQTYIKSTSGAFTVSVPSIPGVAPTIYEMLIYGGGGGANYSGGGGGGYRIAASKLSSSSGSQNVTGDVGVGGTGGNGGGGAGGATAGGSTTLTIGNTTYTATGGQPANWLTNGGASGSGDNTSKAGGTGNYGYTYVSGYNQWNDASCGCCSTDKYGICNAYCSCNNPNSPIYSTDYSRYAGGGGGGTDTVGGNAAYPDGGGNGGTGGGAYGLRGGNGGRGGGTAYFGVDGGTVGSGPIVGKGGSGWTGAGLAGGVTFKYYGP